MVNIIQVHSSLCRLLVELYLTQTAVQSKKKAKVFLNGNFSVWLLQKLKVLCYTLFTSSNPLSPTWLLLAVWFACVQYTPY